MIIIDDIIEELQDINNKIWDMGCKNQLSDEQFIKLSEARKLIWQVMEDI